MRAGNLPMEVLDQEERRMVLVAIDKQWQEHLYNMDALRDLREPIRKKVRDFQGSFVAGLLI